jgi:hypothetical protein
MDHTAKPCTHWTQPLALKVTQLVLNFQILGLVNKSNMDGEPMQNVPLSLLSVNNKTKWYS